MATIEQAPNLCELCEILILIVQTLLPFIGAGKGGQGTWPLLNFKALHI